MQASKDRMDDAEVKETILRRVVNHDGHASVLCSLLGGAPLSVPQLSTRLDKPELLVNIWVAMLDRFDLVECDRATGAYTATLDGHPKWVRETVRQNCARAL